MLGQTVGHFKIIEKIGSGGMGIVYKAQDLALDRIVALKSLPPTDVNDQGAVARLIQEARVASMLDHPNICTIHEISQTQEGQVFIAMAYYEGETLSKKLRRGRLLRREALRIAKDVGLGLAKAHRHGVVHRDIKPSNIILTTDGLVKILDFGVAQLASIASTARRTGGGTPAYMSPEQVGDEPVDQRADIWAWGLVLFEMLTGWAPFRGEKRRARAGSGSPGRLRPADFLRDMVPSAPVAVLTKALQENPCDRYSQIDQALAELEPFCAAEANAAGRRETAAEARSAPSIAVLPFRSVGHDSDDEDFSHGLVEELTDALSQIDGLQVAPRTSVLALKDTTGLAEAASKLRVALVLQGTVRRSLHRLRVNVQLVDATEERVVWSQRFDRDLTDLFAVQEDIATKVVGTLRLRFADRAATGLVKRYTQNLHAYNLYLKGRYQWNRETPEALFKAVETLGQANQTDPAYVLPLCGLAECYLVMGARALLPPAEAWAKAREASSTALALDPTLADAHACLGAILAINDFNWGAAEREFGRGLELNAESASTRHWYAISVLAPLGRFDEALAETARAIECEPLSLIYNSTLAWIYYLSGRFEWATEQCAKTLEIDPHHSDSLWCLGASCRELGRIPEAVAALKELEKIAGGIPLVYGSLGHGYATAGNFAEAEKMIRAVQDAGRNIYSAPICESWIYANLPGCEDRALDCLEQAYADRDFLIRFIRMSSALKPLYGHPRFHALTRKMGLDESPTKSLEKTMAQSFSSSTVAR